MRIVALNGSPRSGGNTELLLREALKPIEQAGHDVVTFIPMGQNFLITARSKKLDGLLPGPVSSFWNVSKLN